MSTRINGSARRQHVHGAKGGIGQNRCPVCGSPITAKVRAEIEARDRARGEAIERAVRAQYETRARAAIEKAKREAMKSAEQQIKTLRASQEERIAQRLTAQRETLTKQASEVIAAERVKFFGEKQALEVRLADLQRRLQAKPAHQIGEPAEADVHKALVAACPDDRISRVGKGVKGADVIVEVIHNDSVVGKIVVEVKAHARWSNSFIQKAREDQLRESAEFAVIASAVMPSSATGDLHVQDKVIVTSYGNLPVLIGLLRRVLVQNHVLRLSREGKDEKADKLYKFIVSAQATDLFDGLHRVADDMIDLECKEVEQHHKNWRRRGEMLRIVQKTHDDLVAAIDAIIGGAMPDVQEA